MGDDGIKNAMRHCPICREKSGIRIIYGSPPMEVYFLHLKGEVILGECRRNKSSPDWQCKLCGHQWIEQPARVT